MMKKKPFAWLSLLLAFGLLAAACSDDKEPEETGDDGGSQDASAYADLSGTLTGSGASFPDAFYQFAIDEFSEVSDLTVNYNPVGSGTGKAEFAGNLNDFAGTDSLVKEEEAPAGSYLYVPTVAAPITVSYNLSGVEDLQLSADTLAGIFQGTISSWDDEAIAADNPDADLPSKAIVMVHRADGSGTTTNFTKYLDKASDLWTLGSGDTVEWPTNSQAGQKNTGVAQLIKDNDGAIGYVDLSDAEAVGLTFAAIRNQAGEYVEPTLEAASAALEGAEVAEDLSYDPLDADGAEAYPITAPTYLLVRPTYSSQATVDNVVGFITFLLTEGQDLAEEVAYAKLPTELHQRALAQLAKITVG